MAMITRYRITNKGLRRTKSKRAKIASLSTLVGRDATINQLVILEMLKRRGALGATSERLRDQTRDIRSIAVVLRDLLRRGDIEKVISAT